MSFKYIDKDAVVNWVNMQDVSFSVTDIPDDVVKMSVSKIDAELMNMGVIEIPTEDDEYHFLRYAAFCWILNLLCRAGTITQSNGNVLSEEFGEVTRRYQSAMPMFFFATGTSKPFQELLPNETFRMMMYAYLNAYKKLLFIQENGRSIAVPKMAFDRTSRGMGWNTAIEKIERADRLYGDYYREWYAENEYLFP